MIPEPCSSHPYLYARWSTFSDRFHNVSFTMQSHDHYWSPLTFSLFNSVTWFVFLPHSWSEFPVNSPKLNIKRKVTNIDDFKFEDFEIEGYKPYPKITMQMAVWGSFTMTVWRSLCRWLCEGHSQWQCEDHYADGCVRVIHNDSVKITMQMAVWGSFTMTVWRSFTMTVWRSCSMTLKVKDNDNVWHAQGQLRLILIWSISFMHQNCIVSEPAFKMHVLL